MLTQLNLKYNNEALSREEEIRKIFDRQVKDGIQFENINHGMIFGRKFKKNPKKVIIEGDVCIHESVFNQEQIMYLETRCITSNGFCRERNRVKCICHTARDFEIM